MRIDQLNKALTLAFKTKTAVELIGGFGIGKSTVVRDFVRALEQKTKRPVGLVECLVPTFAVEDIRGFPMPDYEKGDMFYSVPPFFPSKRKFPNGIPKLGVIFLDEYRLGAEEVVKATTQFLLERRIGDHSLDQFGHWVVFAASNREQDRVGIGKEAPIITQRKIVLEVEPDITSLVSWMEQAETSQPLVNNQPYRVPPVFRFFANQNPQIVLANKTPDDGKPFCTPRTLVEAGNLTAEYMGLIGFKPANKYDIPIDDFLLELLGGKIGEAAAAQLQSYARMVGQVPSYEEIMADPGNAKLPDADRMDAAYTVITVIAHQAGDWSRGKDGVPDMEKLEHEVNALVTYLMRLPSEFQVVGLGRTFERCPAVYSHPKIREIAAKNPTVMKAISGI